MRCSSIVLFIAFPIQKKSLHIASNNKEYVGF